MPVDSSLSGWKLCRHEDVLLTGVLCPGGPEEDTLKEASQRGSTCPVRSTNFCGGRMTGVLTNGREFGALDTA